ncbi:putative calpain-like cysteine peptidase putative cysteine peptidase Clan CA family C2 [Leptomonas seymouri]|uniref:Putative calpain-like cysteine peptidase putative cysteine peptidase Clan CA family C2 n=1 Tax=Leptomonas seymouri TaxID=5684 RepID=A0A0N1ILQ8_LEPSE|nr:putative calpain-like cysteine peptidase putative cysteine peptidase Clan CA family C2 [Leptomonas seymouri]|eukprot:KPI88155.1 putative calpain-like cysteine peptidase putative cysteine peptidase Clan CA family C2 [Leptomonas seymouri]
MAAVAEHPFILRAFRHPKFSEQAKDECAIGAFRVTLNVRGWWRSVVVDDFTHATDVNYPKYAHRSRDVRELWMLLLGKALAGVHGGCASFVVGDPPQHHGHLHRVDRCAVRHLQL